MKANVSLSVKELTILLNWYAEAYDSVGNSLGQKDDSLKLKLTTILKHLRVVKEAMGEAVQTPKINLAESDLNESDLNGTNLNQPGLGDYKVADHEMPEPEESSRDLVREAFEELQYDDPDVVWCKETTRYVYAECGNQAKNWNREYFFWLKGIQWMSNLKESDR